MGYHPTRGWISETALVRRGEYSKPRAIEIRGSLYAQGCVVVTHVIACKATESAWGLEMLAQQKSRTRIR